MSFIVQCHLFRIRVVHWSEIIADKTFTQSGTTVVPYVGSLSGFKITSTGFPDVRDTKKW